LPWRAWASASSRWRSAFTSTGAQCHGWDWGLRATEGEGPTRSGADRQGYRSLTVAEPLGKRMMSSLVAPRAGLEGKLRERQAHGVRRWTGGPPYQAPSAISVVLRKTLDRAKPVQHTWIWSSRTATPQLRMPVHNQNRPGRTRELCCLLLRPEHWAVPERGPLGRPHAGAVQLCRRRPREWRRPKRFEPGPGSVRESRERL
jgi:hypothetical protein